MMARSLMPGLSGSLLSVSVSSGQRVTTISLAGELDRSNEHEARVEIERLLKSGVTCLVVDLGRLHFMDSSGLNLLARTYHTILQRHGSLGVVARTGAVRRALEVMRFGTVVPIYATLDEALADLAPPALPSLSAGAGPPAPV